MAYLAVPVGQAHPREKLASLLWGDTQDAQARGNLRYALSRIGKALPRSARPGLVLDGPSVALDPAIVDVDVARLERLVADGRPEALEQIAGLYRGDLLAGLVLAERPFEEWLTSERERLHELAIQGLGRLLLHQQSAGAAERPFRPASVFSRWTRYRSPSTARSCGSTRGSGAGRLRCASTSFAWTHCDGAPHTARGGNHPALPGHRARAGHAPRPGRGARPRERGRRAGPGRRSPVHPDSGAAGGPATHESPGADLGADRPGGCARGGDGAVREFTGSSP